jgi:ankyrin repeat protein
MNSSRNIETLITAAIEGDEKTVLSLLNRNEVNINDKDDIGSTALMCAAMFNNERMVSLLIDRGADINIKNNIGLTALDEAKRKYNPYIVPIIQQVNIYFINS